jgi:hypothetical protein
MPLSDQEEQQLNAGIEQQALISERSARARAAGYPGDSPDEYRERPARASLHYDRVYLPTGHSLCDGKAHLKPASYYGVLCKRGYYACCVADAGCCCSLKLRDAPYDMIDRALESGACACAHELSPDEWMGTGSQDERDLAAMLDLCTGCFAARERELPDPRLGRGHDQEMT